MRDKLLKVVNKDIVYHIAERDNKVIDEFGIAKVLKDLYVECMVKLGEASILIISDGILKIDNPAISAYTVVSMVKADQQISTVMAASILAKTHRDTYMKSLDSKYDVYDFKSNVGYASIHNLSRHGKAWVIRFA